MLTDAVALHCLLLEDDNPSLKFSQFAAEFFFLTDCIRHVFGTAQAGTMLSRKVHNTDTDEKCYEIDHISKWQETKDTSLHCEMGKRRGEWWLDFRFRFLPRVHRMKEAHGVEETHHGLIGRLAASGGPFLFVGRRGHLFRVWEKVNLVHPASEREWIVSYSRSAYASNF